MGDFLQCSRTYSCLQSKTIAEEFTRGEGDYYLEHAGATLYSEKQIQEVALQLSKNLYANPHARNLSSKITEDAVDIIRFQILEHFGTTPNEYSVVFTSGATAALKLIAESFTYENSDATSCGNFVFLQDNHTSVLGMRAHSQFSNCINVDDAFHNLEDNTGYIQGKNFCNSLFVYPAQSNFSGTKYPLSWIEKVKEGALNQFLKLDCQNWYVALDAASYASTNKLDLSLVKPDFVTISFYKIFGYPTGLGALLIKNSSSHVLKKKYYGGGTVLMAQTLQNSAVFRDLIHERFEDGTIPFLSIIALKQGFKTIERFNLTFDDISKHTFSLAQYVYRNLLSFHHSNGKPAVVLYHNTTFQCSSSQGGIVNFNILRDNDEYVGFAEVLHFANLYRIHLRTGCFCNPGACQYFLKLSPDDVKRHFDAGHVCGDQHDLVEGYPTGSVRISFGYMSTKRDADQMLEMIRDCFITKPVIMKIPETYDLLCKKYSQYFASAFVATTTKPLSYLRAQSQENLALINQDIDINSDIGILEQIVLYPIKSCGGYSVVNNWPITSTGLKYDREWMVVNSSGVCFTQKHNKKMCLIKPIIYLETDTLVLTYPGYRNISVPINLNANVSLNLASLCQSKVCGDKIQGWDCGNEVSEWLSEVLDTPGIRLLKQSADDDKSVSRTAKENEGLQLSLVNKAQYLLINSASVKWLREKINDGEFTEDLQTTIQRFRPNLIVKFKHPFMENDYGDFIFENIKFQTGGKCTRCQMICIDQMTAKASKEPLQTLSKVFKGKISFGVYLNNSENCSSKYLTIGSAVKGIK